MSLYVCDMRVYVDQAIYDTLNKIMSIFYIIVPVNSVSCQM